MFTSPLSPVRKALAPVVLALIGVGTRWLTTGTFSTDQELYVAIMGVVTAGLVYAIPNLATSKFAAMLKAVTALGVAVLTVAAQWLLTGSWQDSQELTTAATGLLMTLAVFFVPNEAGPVPQSQQGRL